jgi:hypothetical protein
MRKPLKTVTVARVHFEKWQARTREPGLTALLIIEVLLLFVVTPLVGMGLLPALVVRLMLGLFVLATLIVTSRSHVAAAAVLAAVVLGVGGAIVHAEHPSIFTEWLSAGATLMAVAALSIVIARAVFGPGRVTVHRVQGAIVLYLNFALFFSIIYRLMEVVLPHSFSGLPQVGAENGSGSALLYFSFATLTTSGFGDITPLHPLARNLASLEATIGALYPATLIARLVSLEIQHRRETNNK